jgi:hypothetical protein
MAEQGPALNRSPCLRPSKPLIIRPNDSSGVNDTLFIFPQHDEYDEALPVGSLL